MSRFDEKEEEEEKKKEQQQQQAPKKLPPTDMLYMTYEGNWLMECESEILHIQPVNTSSNSNDTEEKRTNNTEVSVVLDQTVMHAQGGGQPTDIGKLIKKENDNNVWCMEVNKVTIDRSTGIATHTGMVSEDETTSNDFINIGDKVHVMVDKETRRILSECHTAGHVVDSAMAKIGKLMKPSKAYHFLQGPYVEYIGTISSNEKDAVLQELQNAFNELLQENISTEITLMSKEEADLLCNRQANNFDMDIFADPITDQIRVVTVAGFPCPCGGTHVKSTGELVTNGWNITGIKSKKGVVRVKYGQKNGT